MSDPHVPIKIQNQSLLAGLSGMSDYYSMERNEFARKTDRLPILGYIRSGLLVLYAVVYFVLLLVLFLKAKQLSLRIKFAIAAIFALYPFFIYVVENAAIQMYYYVYSVIYGQSYHEIMARKGLQNPKNFRDITNTTRSIKAGLKPAIDYIPKFKTQLDSLPATLQTEFAQLNDLLQVIPENVQYAYMVTQTEIIGTYNNAVSTLTTIALDKIQPTVVNFWNDMNQKIKDFIKQLQGVSQDTIQKVSAQFIQLKNAFITKVLLQYAQQSQLPKELKPNSDRLLALIQNSPSGGGGGTISDTIPQNVILTDDTKMQLFGVTLAMMAIYFDFINKMKKLKVDDVPKAMSEFNTQLNNTVMTCIGKLQGLTSDTMSFILISLILYKDSIMVQTLRFFENFAISQLATTSPTITTNIIDLSGSVVYSIDDVKQLLTNYDANMGALAQNCINEINSVKSITESKTVISKYIAIFDAQTQNIVDSITNAGSISGIADDKKNKLVNLFTTIKGTIHDALQGLQPAT